MCKTTRRAPSQKLNYFIKITVFHHVKNAKDVKSTTFRSTASLFAVHSRFDNKSNYYLSYL